MKNLYLIFLLVFNFTYAQKVEFLEKKDTLEKPKLQQFIYIAENSDLSDSKYVAKIKSTGKLNNVSNLFLSIKSEAQKVGSNSFKFESFRKIDNENGELILLTYYNEEAFFEANFQNLPKDKIFIFGNQNLSTETTQNYKVDGEKFEIESGKYQEFERKSDKETKINKGGFTGMTFWISKSENGYCSFLSFSGIGLNGANYYPANAGVGISFNTGSINKIEPNLALTLLKIYSKKN